MLDLKQIDKVVLNALEEDMPYGDITTDSLIPEDRMVEAKFLAKADGVICGMPVAERVFKLIDATVKPYKREKSSRSCAALRRLY